MDRAPRASWPDRIDTPADDEEHDRSPSPPRVGRGRSAGPPAARASGMSTAPAPARAPAASYEEDDGDGLPEHGSPFDGRLAAGSRAGGSRGGGGGSWGGSDAGFGPEAEPPQPVARALGPPRRGPERGSSAGGSGAGAPAASWLSSDVDRGSQLPTPPVFADWFRLADADRDGRINGREGVAFFGRSQLPQATLAKIWNLADASRRGWLGFDEFCDALWLVTLAQAGKEPSTGNLQLLLEGSLGRRPVPQLAGINVQPPPPAASPPRGVSTSGSGLGRMGVAECASMAEALSGIYARTVLPLEATYLFHEFHTPPLGPADFHAKPTVLLLGQYSVGKTTFIRHLLGREYPGSQIGPEPTTDRFVAIMHGHDERMTPGNTLAVQKEKPFAGLAKFGTAFLNRFAGSELPAELLEHVTLIDTPGVLSGEKQRVDRLYDFPGVSRWFAERADMILLLFDPHKLDISDEFRRVIGSLAGYDDKVRVVLNKADAVDGQQLMRVYGALMWALSRILRQPEVPRVYVSNFPGQDAPPPPNLTRASSTSTSANAALLAKEREDLLSDLRDLPRVHVARQVNEFVKRVRYLRIHCLLVGRLREQMPLLSGFVAKQRKLVENLELTFRDVQRKHQLPVGDFPDLERFRETLRAQQIIKFPRTDPKAVARLDGVLEVELPALLRQFGNPFELAMGGR